MRILPLHITLGILSLRLIFVMFLVLAKDLLAQADQGKVKNEREDYLPEKCSDLATDITLHDKWKIVDNPPLPRVLILGDSISIWHTLDVRNLLD